MRKLGTAFLLTLAVLLCSCTTTTPSREDVTTTAPTTATTTSPLWDAEDHQSGDADTADAVLITLADNATTANGDGVSVSGNVVTVYKAGRYVVRGTLSDGQLRVECKDDAAVQLVLDGVAIQSNTTAPLFVRKSEKTILTLAAGSVNTLRDGENFTYEDTENEEPSATLFSKSDLVIGGEGTLAVTAVYNDGIVSRDGLKISGGVITVDAADDAVMGRDYVLIGGGDITLNADGDGVKSTNDNDDTVGYITVEGGKLTVASGKDGIQAQSHLTIQGGDVSVVAGGGSQNGSANADYDFGWGMNSRDTSSEGKGLKVGGTLTVSGGTVQIDAADDALHSNQAILIGGGDVTAAAGDDGLHADVSLTITAGKLHVTKSYEGLESETITIEGGDVSVIASDDGVNATGGSADTVGNRGDMFANDDSAFYIRGGTVYIDAKGDGLDSNGVVEMSGGEVYVVGPSSGGNGSLDYNGTFTVTGGKLVAIGSTGMAESPTSSTMNSIVWGGFTMYDADELIVTASDGIEIARLKALRSASWMYITCPELITGDEVTVTCGTQQKTFTITEGGNSEGSVGGMFGGGDPGMGGGMGRPGGYHR